MESLKLLLTYSIHLYTQAIGPLMSGILVEILHLGWVKLNLVYFMICFTMTSYEVFVGKACHSCVLEEQFKKINLLLPLQIINFISS